MEDEWKSGSLPVIGRKVQLRLTDHIECGVIIPHHENSDRRVVIRVTNGGYLRWVEMYTSWRYIDIDEHVKTQTSEGESMFSAGAAPAKGGDRAIVTNTDNNKVVWESEEIFKTTGEGNEQVLGSSKARTKAQEVIDSVVEGLFAKAK